MKWNNEDDRIFFLFLQHFLWHFIWFSSFIFCVLSSLSVRVCVCVEHFVGCLEATAMKLWDMQIMPCLTCLDLWLIWLFSFGLWGVKNENVKFIEKCKKHTNSAALLPLQSLTTEVNKSKYDLTGLGSGQTSWLLGWALIVSLLVHLRPYTCLTCWACVRLAGWVSVSFRICKLALKMRADWSALKPIAGSSRRTNENGKWVS